MGDVAAAATNLAFPIELYIKGILIASRIEPPTGRDGHNLVKLYAALPQHFKDVIERSYEETRKNDWNGRYPSITVAMRPEPANLPTISGRKRTKHRRNEVRRNGLKRSRFASLKSSLFPTYKSDTDNQR
jgi:hypothetical protein